MSLAQCTKCNEEVLVPAGASRSAIVRCPLCEAEFPLSEVLDRMPPSFVVVSDPDAGSGGAAAASSGFSFGEVDEPADNEPAGFGFDPHAGPSQEPTKSLASPPSRSRKKAPPKNAILEIVKIVGGGVAGILLAVLIIWWGVGTDPFGFADDVARYVPFIVPASLHGEPAPAEDSSEPQDDGGEANNSSTTANQNGKRGNNNKQANNNNNKQPDPNAFKQPLSTGEGGFNPDITGNTDGDPFSVDSIEPIAGDASEFNLLDGVELPADSSELTDLGELNPDLNELNPDLNDLNPDLNELNPDLNELNPTVDPEGDLETDPEGDPEADPES